MDVTKYNIFRVTTNQVVNAWNEILFNSCELVHCVEDLGTIWLAKPIGSNEIPRMLPKSATRELTSKERKSNV